MLTSGSRTLPCRSLDAVLPFIAVDESGAKQSYAPEDISAIVLTHLKEAAELHFNNQIVRDVVITVPAYFTDAQRKVCTLTRDHIAFILLRLPNATTAAKFAY